MHIPRSFSHIYGGFKTKLMMERNTAIDLTYIRDLVQDEEMVKDLIQTFYEEGPKDFDILMSAVNNRDHANSRVYAHKLKSSLGIFQVESLRAEFEKLEKRCIQQEDFTEIETHTQSLKTPLLSLIQSMEAYL